MTNDIAIREDRSLVQQTAADMDAAYRIAEVLCRTSFAPQHFRGKPEEATVAILYGQGIGMDPQTALQNLYVISGKPALYARAMVAIVLGAGHEVWTEVSTDECVTVCGKRKGTENVERAEWTIERAKKAGYTTNKKYQTDPQAMLYARASGDIARHIAPDALLGMAYNVEELQAAEVVDGAHRITHAAPPRRATAARAKPTPAVDVDNLAAAVDATADPDTLRDLWRECGGLPDDAKADLRAIIEAKIEANVVEAEIVGEQA
jgi:hypothetical protein